MNNTNSKSLTLLFNPFVYIAGSQALFLGLAAILLAGFIGSLSNTHFDGVLDTHTGASAPLWFFLFEGITSWLCMAVVFLILGRIISKTSFRTIDVFGTQALARWPTILISLVVLPPGFRRFSDDLVAQFSAGGTLKFNTADAIVFFLAIALMIPLVCWMVYLMYKAFSVSCNVKGGKAIGTFIGGLIGAEALSKIAIYAVMASVVTGRAESATPSADSPEKKAAVAAAETWLGLIDKGEYAQSWNDTTSYFKKAVTKDNWVKTLNKVRKPMGELVSRKLNKAWTASQLPGAPEGQHVVMQFSTEFREAKDITETVTFSLEKDGTWKAGGYFVK